MFTAGSTHRAKHSLPSEGERISRRKQCQGGFGTHIGIDGVFFQTVAASTALRHHDAPRILPVVPFHREFGGGKVPHIAGQIEGRKLGFNHRASFQGLLRVPGTVSPTFRATAA